MFENVSHEIKGQSVTIQLPKLEDWPISHLRKACMKNKVKGYTTMNKEQLVEAVRKIFKELDEKKEALK